MPLTMRLPKRGFTNKWRVEYATVNVDRLNIFEDGATVTPVELVESGILKNVQDGVKILGNGEITKNLTVKALGLHHVGHTVVKEDNPAIRGMIFKVKHMVKVEEIAE